MKILFADSVRVWAGAQKFVLETARGLRSRGHTIEIQTFPETPLAVRARDEGFTVHQNSTRADAAPWTVIPIAARMARSHFDLVLTTFDKDLRNTGLAAKLASPRTIVVHSRECDDPLKDKTIYRWFYNRVADHIIVNSEATRKTTLHSAPWLDPKRTSVVYKGIDLGPFEKLSSLRSSVSAKTDVSPVVIGFAGQLVARKRIQVLIEALTSEANRKLPWRLQIAGKGPEEGALRRLAGQLGLDERVEFVGYVEDIPEWMSTLDIFALPSLIEGFGYVLAEAAAAGCPSVAYRASSIPEVVREGETALLAESGDDESFAQHLRTLILDDNLRKTMGVRAREDAFDRHGIDKMIDRLESKMTELVFARSGPQKDQRNSSKERK